MGITTGMAVAMAASAAASAAGGMMAKGAAGSAAGAAGAAAQNADYIRHRNEANLSGWFQSGQGAQGLISQLLGLGSLGPDGQGYGGLKLNDGNWQQDQQNALARFQASPDYNFRFNEGQRALDRSAAARGNLLSGKQVKASQEYGGNLASGEYNNWFGKLTGVANQGLAAANSENSSNLQAAGLQNSALMQQGAAQTAGSNALTNGLMSGVSNIASIYGYGAGGGFGGMGGGTNMLRPGQSGYGNVLSSLGVV